MNIRKIFTDIDLKEIETAIQQAELNTSGEIRVRIENICKIDPYQRALENFEFLKMYETAEQNAILFYLAVESQKFAIVGDEGIHAHVTEDFWNSLRDTMTQEFKNQNFKKGLINAILLCGEKLKQYYPYQYNDVNELSNEISIDHE